MINCRDLTVGYSLLDRKRDVLCRNFGVKTHSRTHVVAATADTWRARYDQSKNI